MGKKNKKEERVANIPDAKANQATDTTIIYKEGMTVAEVAAALNKSNAQIIKKLLEAGIFANQNQSLERETIELLALEYGFEIKDEIITDETRFDEIVIEDDESNLVKRPPVVTIMGHVDHGKTTLLDTIRNSRVASGEAGGITQHIGAYQVEKNGNKITFIDTPGHAAFTDMRARGAQITDIVILVVAADDGVMPQTEEAIAHAKAAGCPIIVAVNKIDKPAARPERVMEELSRFNLVPEAWGGNTIFVNISALKGQGVDELLEMVLLTAEMLDLKANPNRLAMGTVIEAQLDRGRGPLATFLVQNGTLKVGDVIVCGDTYGKVRSMEDDRHIKYNKAEPSQAVVVTGLNAVPLAGDKFMVFSDEHKARDIAEARANRKKDEIALSSKPKTFADMVEALDKTKELNVIVKGDVQGSVEALCASLQRINVEDYKVTIIRQAVGAITETDISLAEASNAIIIGFNIRPLANIRKDADEKHVEIRSYNIIYKALEDIEGILKGKLEPEYEEVVTGQAEVRSIFKLSKVGTIAGCYVTDGTIERNSKIRVLRDGAVIYEGVMASLKRFKDDVKEVRQGLECGITIQGYNDIKEGDVFEASVDKEIER